MRNRDRARAAWDFEHAQQRISRYSRLRLESLELRAMLSASTQTADPQVAILSTASSSTSPSGLTPAEVKTAYSLAGISGDGSGQTIAIVDAYDDPNIAQDLATFDAKYGLAAASLTKVEMTSGGRAPATDAGWSAEISLDVEWAHAIAPGAKLLLVEAADSNLTSLMSAVNYARDAAGVSVVSMSWGSTEFAGETAYDSDFTTPTGHTPVAFVASAGDSGAEAIWPAVSTNVLAVGGTTLTTSSTGGYQSESAWVDSGGGYSQFETEPGYQDSVQSSGRRSTPDVALDANPATGYSVYDSVSYDGRSGWEVVGGTSAGAPQWSAIVAIADQGRVAAGKTDIGNAASAVYSISTSDFHDITSGGNGYSATQGYDTATGLGTPIGSSVISDLISGTLTTSTTTAGTTTSGSPSSPAPGSSSSGTHISPPQGGYGGYGYGGYGGYGGAFGGHGYDVVGAGDSELQNIAFSLATGSAAAGESVANTSATNAQAASNTAPAVESNTPLGTAESPLASGGLASMARITESDQVDPDQSRGEPAENSAADAVFASQPGSRQFGVGRGIAPRPTDTVVTPAQVGRISSSGAERSAFKVLGALDECFATGGWLEHSNDSAGSGFEPEGAVLSLDRAAEAMSDKAWLAAVIGLTGYLQMTLKPAADRRDLAELRTRAPRLPR